MSDAGPQEQISEEELQAYMAQLRDAPLTDVVAQTVSVLLNAAQVKLGRPDGRTLIDVVAAVRDAAGDALDDRLVQELDNALSQLRMAQVEAEGREASAAQVPEPDADDVAAPTHRAGEQPPSGDTGNSKLWTPGQP